MSLCLKWLNNYGVITCCQIPALLEAACSCLWPIYEADGWKVKRALCAAAFCVSSERADDVLLWPPSPRLVPISKHIDSNMEGWKNFRRVECIIECWIYAPTLVLTWFEPLWKSRRGMQLKSKAAEIPSPHLASFTATAVECRWENIFLFRLDCVLEFSFNDTSNEESCISLDIDWRVAFRGTTALTHFVFWAKASMVLTSYPGGLCSPRSRFIDCVETRENGPEWGRRLSVERGRTCGFATFKNLIAKRMTHAGPVFTLKHLIWKKKTKPSRWCLRVLITCLLNLCLLHLHGCKVFMQIGPILSEKVSMTPSFVYYSVIKRQLRVMSL